MENFVISEFVSAFVANDPKGRKSEFINRRYSCFIITKKGKIRFSFGDSYVISDPEHAVFLPKGLSYINECLETAESYVFNFQTADIYEEPLQLSAISEESVTKYYETIISSSFSPTMENMLLIFESLYSLARRLLDKNLAESYLHPITKKAMDFMRRYCAQADLSVKDVAGHCCISEIYLRKLFERELNTTPFRQLTAIRMKKAVFLIEEKRPLKEIALSVGYSDVFQFSRAFKRYFGYPPSKIR